MCLQGVMSVFCPNPCSCLCPFREKTEELQRTQQELSECRQTLEDCVADRNRLRVLEEVLTSLHLIFFPHILSDIRQRQRVQPSPSRVSLCVCVNIITSESSRFEFGTVLASLIMACLCPVLFLFGVVGAEQPKRPLSELSVSLRKRRVNSAERWRRPRNW